MEFKSPDHLLARLTSNHGSGGRKVMFLVGSALTMPHRSKPGVANVAGMIELIREQFRTSWTDPRVVKNELRRFEDAINGDPSRQYQRGFELLKATAGIEAAHRVVRAGVLRARVGATPVNLDDGEALAQLERNEEGWHLGPAVKSLGLLLAHHEQRFARTVLTTNFDPLVEIAVRAAGGAAQAIEFLGDGTLGLEDPRVTRVVHLHGLWRGDTRHTVGALTIPRPTLVRELAKMFESTILVVVGYGGWDDVLTEAVAELGKRGGAKPEVLWCFYERAGEDINKKYPTVLAKLRMLGERADCYAGVDCNEVLPQLRAALDGESELLGRAAVCDQLRDALEGEHAIEILGERQMGRTRLLEWIKEQAKLEGKPVAHISAKEVGGSPVTLVRKLADALGRREQIERELRRDRAHPGIDDATRAITSLRGAWILIDDAEELARAGHEFEEKFFSNFRAEVQSRALLWVSVSRVPLGPLFTASGLISRFLNDAVPVVAGALERREVEVGLRARLGSRADRAMTLAGTLPVLCYRLCDAEFGDVEGELSRLSGWAEPVFSAWWEREPEERVILIRALESLRRSELAEGEKTSANRLCQRGLLTETGDRYFINGSAWEAYVRTRK